MQVPSSQGYGATMVGWVERMDSALRNDAAAGDHVVVAGFGFVDPHGLGNRGQLIEIAGVVPQVGKSTMRCRLHLYSGYYTASKRTRPPERSSRLSYCCILAQSSAGKDSHS